MEKVKAPPEKKESTTVVLTIPDRMRMIADRRILLGPPLENIPIRSGVLLEMEQRLAAYDVTCMNLAQVSAAWHKATTDPKPNVKLVEGLTKQLLQTLEYVRQVTVESMSDVLPKPKPKPQPPVPEPVFKKEVAAKTK